MFLLEQIIDLSIGSVAIEPSENMRKYSAAVCLEKWGGYTSPFGLTQLRKDILSNFSHNFSNIELENVLITQGATMGLNLIYQMFKGESILIPDPGFPLYGESAELYDINIHRYRLGWGIDWEQTLSDIKEGLEQGVKLVIVNNPNNPNGFLFNREQIEMIANLCSEYNVHCISDEVYRDFSFQDDPVPSLVEYIPERTFLLYSFSKSYAMAGFRVGFLIHTNKEYIKTLSLYHWRTMMSVSWQGQKIASYVLKHEEGFPNKVKKQIKDNITYIVERLHEHDISFFVPEGGIFLCLDISKLNKNSIEFEQQIFKEKRVLISPCAPFGTTGDQIIRINVALEHEKFQYAIDEVIDFIQSERVVAK